MKRSEINSVIKEMEELVRKNGLYLPPFCNFTPEKWKELGSEYEEVINCQLGWDITDFGLGDFDKVGFGLITLRNGKLNEEKYPKPYAEKLIMLREDQTAPTHYHWSKMEDIINRGGGTLLITVYNGNKDKSINSDDVTIYSDGRCYTVPSGTAIRLEKGESITLRQYQYHNFAVEKGTGTVLIGEVSMCNDDNNDNCFYEAIGRFPTIEEDELPYRLLCNEYPTK